jgi:hypothetical protein
VDKPVLWKERLFADSIPAEIILRIARAFIFDADPDNQSLDQSILEWLAVEAFRTGADYREVPWALRLLHVKLTGEPEGKKLKRPPTGGIT